MEYLNPVSLRRLTRAQLRALLSEALAKLQALPPSSPERPILQANILNLRQALGLQASTTFVARAMVSMTRHRMKTGTSSIVNDLLIRQLSVTIRRR
jgi:hypothetical protein